VFSLPRETGDVIEDFSNTRGNNDRFVIDWYGFTMFDVELGKLWREHFQVSAGHQARNADVRFIFDTRDETLWFDANGSETVEPRLVADLQDGATMTHSDIWLV